MLGQDHLDAALTYNNLGNLLNSQGRYIEALPLLQKGVTILQKRLQQDHPHLAPACANVTDIGVPLNENDPAEIIVRAIREAKLL